MKKIVMTIKGSLKTSKTFFHFPPFSTICLLKSFFELKFMVYVQLQDEN